MSDQNRPSISQWLYEKLGPISVEEGGKVYKTTEGGIIIEDAAGQQVEVTAEPANGAKKNNALTWLSIGGLGVFISQLFS